jgi:hypothetical protein
MLRPATQFNPALVRASVSPVLPGLLLAMVTIRDYAGRVWRE